MHLSTKQLSELLSFSSSFKKEIVKHVHDSLPASSKRKIDGKARELIHSMLLEEGILRVAFETLLTRLSCKKITSKHYVEALGLFSQCSFFENLIQAITGHLITELSGSPVRGTQNTTLMLENSEEARETLRLEINDWVDEQYSPIDKRVPFSDERHIRRMDSFARLLSLAARHSVCTAVAFLPGEESELIISTNLSYHGQQDELFTYTLAKLDTIARILTDFKKMPAPEDVDKLSNFLVTELYTPRTGGSSFPRETLKQAAKKLIDAVCFDVETFTENQIRAILNPLQTKIMFSTLLDDGSMGICIKHYNREADILLSLAALKKQTPINRVHAEQMVAHYLHAQRNVSRPFTIGISKLCCLTCFRHLSHYPMRITVRGHHSQIYEGVVDIHTGIAEVDSGRPHITYAWASPGDTPEKRKRKAEPSATSPAKIPRQTIRLFDSLLPPTIKRPDLTQLATISEASEADESETVLSM